MNYQTIKTSSLALGIDQEATENKIGDGFVEDLLNADPKPTGQVDKRPGYQGYAGNLPVRVTEIRQTTSPNMLCFILPTGTDLSGVTSSPIIVEGRQSVSTNGDFPSNVESTSQYYSGFEVDTRRTFATGTNTDTFLQTDHDLSGPIIWGGLATSDSTFNNSNTQFLLDLFKINQSTEDILYTYTNSTGSSFEGFVFLKDKPTTSGTIYNSPMTLLPTGTTNTSILAGIHGLNNNNIIVRVFRDNTTLAVPEARYEEIIPNNITISNIGTVTVQVVNSTGSQFGVIFSLTSVATTNFQTGATSGTSAIVNIDITGESAFLFVGCYQQSGTDLLAVIPDSIITDTTTNLCTITFTTSIPSNFTIFWEFADIIANRLCVTPNNAAATITDIAPQLTIWGLDHSEIYGDMRLAPAGWVNHIDSYNSTGEHRLIAGIGGGIYTVQEQGEGTNATAHLMPTLYPNIQNILNQDITISPAFIDSTDSSSRTRGYVKGDNGASNTFTVDSVSYDSGNGWTKYILTIPNMVVSGSLSTIISTTTGLEDYLTTSQCGWARFDGEFKIKQVTNLGTGLAIWVENSDVTTSDFNEIDVGGFAGVFSDRLTFTGSVVPRFLPDDILLSGLFTELNNYEVINSKLNAGTPTISFRNVITEQILPNTLKVTGRRISDMIPLRTITTSAGSVLNLVRGDMLSYSEINRLLRIKAINALADTTITISVIIGNNEEVSVTGISTTNLYIGKKIVILGASSYSGTQTVSSIISGTEFYITSTISPVADSGTLLGKIIQVDENLTYQDTETSMFNFTVVSRFIPAEFPTDSFTLTPKTRFQYFQANDYINQPIIRSTMVQDNMYFADGADEIMKFDGTNIYRAGLFRWQPNLFVSTDTTVAGKIAINNPSELTTAVPAANIFTIGPAAAITFKVGDLIYFGGDGEYYTVIAITQDSVSAPTKTYIAVDRNITGTGSGAPITRISTFKYYFRLNAIDANNNLLASAVTGSDDFVVRLATSSGVRIKLIGMPVWDIYDYDRLEVQIYRTKANSVSPFYKITTLPMSFNRNDGYITYIDSASDAALFDLDEINTALKGAELGTAWTEPIRAKYVTSADNRLVLGNLVGYPELDIQVVQNNTVLTQSDFTNTSNGQWLFRRSNTDTGSLGNMISRALYQCVDTGSSIPVTGATVISTSLFTLSVANSAVAGDWVYLYHEFPNVINQNLRFSGWWQIVSRTAGTITINNANVDISAFAAGTDVNIAAFSSGGSGAVPVIIGQDYNYNMVNGNRTSAEAYQYLAVKRMAEAINASMRKVDITISGYETFTPWLIAAAGNEIGNGRMIVRQPRADTLNLEFKVPDLNGRMDLYVNGVKRAASAEAGALSRLYPSRIIISYPNFPEIFDAPEAQVDADSDSAIDVNSADGQEITALIPFFGDSAFGAALKSGVVVVFKTNSIYLVDISAKAQGLPAVQKIESMGKGCTVPFSVSVTKAGIMFANETGLYKLTRDMQVVFVGRKYGRLWTEHLNKAVMEFATGTHDTATNSYKLSYPVDNDSENSLVAVYNHTTEEVSGGYGSWTKYDNHPATGWANLLADAYFASTTGRVFSTRKLGEDSDYRDDSESIGMEIRPAAMDFGDSGKRKFVKYVTSHYRGLANTHGTQLQVATELNSSFQDTDLFNVNKTPSNTGLDDIGERKVVTIQSSLPTKKGVYFQLKYLNDVIDEPVSLSGIDYTVSGLSEKGVTQAAKT